MTDFAKWMVSMAAALCFGILVGRATQPDTVHVYEWAPTTTTSTSVAP